ncbi:MAG: hypothetical protein AAGB26_17640 [Planctomycetota bacterium]
MKCNACGSSNLQPIKVFAGHNAMGWSPVAGEKDIFGNYKKLRPLLAHACADCGHVQWNINLGQPRDPNETAAALDELSEFAEQAAHDPGEESVAYSMDDELN